MRRERITRRHKYSVGQMVKLFSVVGVRTSRSIEKSAAGNEFEITRLLPEEGADFHYRVKNAVTGQERVAAESEIKTALA
jgi:hypothetical protein